MKIFCCLLLVLFAEIQAQAGLSPEQEANRAKWAMECKEETGISDELLGKLIKGEIVDDPTVKEQMVCFSKKVGIVTPDGKILRDVLEKKLTAAGYGHLSEVLTECDVDKGSPQETIFHAVKCFYEKKPDFRLA